MEPAWRFPGVNELLRAAVPSKPQMLLFSQKEQIKNQIVTIFSFAGCTVSARTLPLQP